MHGAVVQLQLLFAELMSARGGCILPVSAVLSGVVSSVHAAAAEKRELLNLLVSQLLEIITCVLAMGASWSEKSCPLAAASAQPRL